MNYINSNWFITELCYTPITSFHSDFCIADTYGEDAIKETYNNALQYAKTDYKILTELVTVLNWKRWEYHEIDTQRAGLYDTLYCLCANYAEESLNEEERSYYLRISNLGME